MLINQPLFSKTFSKNKEEQKNLPNVQNQVLIKICNIWYSSYKMIQKGREFMNKRQKSRFVRGSKDPTSLLNQVNNQGQNAFYLAAKNGHVKIVNFLIFEEADPFIKSKVIH